jgi:SAM-dependent methyltransferase
VTAGWTAWWHDVECASYGVDLPLWRELADATSGPILDVGCGTGRVALDLAGRGHEVVGVDADPELVQLLGNRARELALPVRAVAGDARTLDLGSTFALAILPMQVAQLLGGESGRASMLSAMRRHLEPQGLLAIALADPSEDASAEDLLPPLPDMREQDGWVLTSTPVAMREEAGGVAIDRHRQAVSPEGDLTESMNTIFVELVSQETLEAEGAAAGFTVRDARTVPPTRDYVGSTVVLLEAP